MTKLDLYALTWLFQWVQNQRSLRFVFRKGVLYQFACLPFSLSPSAGLFTSALKRVIAFLRSIGTCLVIFLGDILIMADSPERPAEHTEVVMSRLRDKEKEVSQINPDYPVSRLNCKIYKDAPSIVREKIAKLKSSTYLFWKKCPKPERFFSFLGQGQAALPALQMAPLHFRAIQIKLIQVFSPRVTR